MSSNDTAFALVVVLAVLAGTGWGILLAHYAINGSILP